MLFTTLCLVMLSSMALGMLISALVHTIERAVTFYTMLAVLQVALSGALFKIPVSINFLTWILPVRLGFAAVDGCDDLDRHHGLLQFLLPFSAMAVLGIVATAASIHITERRWHG
jgi:uncharacterized phage infection (PIP) family protein YhgE